VLKRVEAGVEAAAPEQLVVGALLGEFPTGEHQDAVDGADGGEAVGDDKGGAVAEQRVQGLLEPGLGDAVDAGGGLVEDEDRGVAVERAGEGEELALRPGAVGEGVAGQGRLEDRVAAPSSKPGPLREAPASLVREVRSEFLWLLDFRNLLQAGGGARQQEMPFGCSEEDRYPDASPRQERPGAPSAPSLSQRETIPEAVLLRGNPDGSGPPWSFHHPSV